MLKYPNFWGVNPRGQRLRIATSSTLVVIEALCNPSAGITVSPISVVHYGAVQLGTNRQGGSGDQHPVLSGHIAGLAFTGEGEH